MSSIATSKILSQTGGGRVSGLDGLRGVAVLLVVAAHTVARTLGGGVEAAASERSGAGAGVVASITNVPDSLDLAIVELGTNDVGGHTPMADFTKTYSDLLDKIRTKSPGVPMMCVGTWGSSGGGYGSDPYNNAIASECQKRDGTFVTMYGLYPAEANRGPAGLSKFGGISDVFHPNDTGYKAIADLLLSRLNVS